MFPKFLPLLLIPFSGFAGEETPGAGRAPIEPRSLPAPDQAVAEVEPALQRLDDGRMKLGDVTFDPKTREIRFPAEINMTEGLLEFLVVHRNGKVHESLFLTDISATHLNLVFKLLHYQASRELYLKLDDDGSLSSNFEEASAEEKKSARIRIGVEWSNDGTKKTNPVNDWISHAITEKAMPSDPWIYGGSFVYDGKFVAESSGDLAAIFLSNSAMINYSGKDNEDDGVWLPFPKRVPEVGTPVTLVINPFDKP